MDANAVNNILIRFAQEGIQTPDAIEATKADILASMPEAVNIYLIFPLRPVLNNRNGEFLVFN